MADSGNKIEQRKQEAYKLKKRNQKRANRKFRPSALKKLIAIICAVVIVLVGCCAAFLNSGFARRIIPAAKIGSEKISAAEYSYYYNSSFTSYYQTMASYFGEQYVGIDMTKSLKDQAYDEDLSYADYFSNDALTSLQFVTAVSSEAKKAGFTLSAEEQERFDSQVADVTKAAEDAGMSIDKYVAQLCGKGYTMDMYKNILHNELLAYDYRAEKEASFTYDASALETYYQEHKDDFDKADYRYVLFSAQEATEDQEAVTLEEAKAQAEAFMDGITNEVQYSAKAEAKAKETDENGTDTSKRTNVTKSSVDSIDANLGSWVFDAARGVEEVGLVERADGTGYYVAMVVTPAHREEYHTANVRHILINVNDNVTEDEARAKAEEIYEEWKNGEATEESFAALANEHSEDTGSNTNGGLYENVYPGEMVTAFDQWVFYAGHKAGDTALIETEYGYHIMYYVSENENEKWAEDVESTLRSEDYNAWYDDILVNYQIKPNWLGMKLRKEPIG